MDMKNRIDGLCVDLVGKELPFDCQSFHPPIQLTHIQSC